MIKRALLVSTTLMQFSKPPAALAFLAGICEKNSVDYEILDINVEIQKRLGMETWEKLLPLSTLTSKPRNDDFVELDDQFELFLDQLVEEIQSQKIDLIAGTALTYLAHYWMFRFLSKIKEKCPTLTIIGGPGVGSPTQLDLNLKDTSFGKHMIDLGVLDYYVLGEGDIIFDRFLSGERDMPGLNSKIKEETWQPQIEDLEELSIPSYKKIDFSRYVSPNGEPIISITSSRGCVRRCSFCDVGHIWKKFRYRSGKNVANELLQHFQDTGVTNFWFTDSLINGSLKQFTEMLETIVDYKKQYPGFEKLKFSGQFIVRPRQSHPEKLFQLMQEAGVSLLDIGIESGSEAVRDHMGKKFSNADIDYHFEMCEKYTIKNWLLMIIGYPTETQKDFQDTLDMLSRSQKYLINDTILGLNLKGTFVFLPNTPLESMRDELGIYDTNGMTRDQTWAVASNPSLTIAERYRRWVNVTTTAIKLGYRLPNEIYSDISYNRQLVHSIDHRNDLNTNNKKTIIPILSNSTIFS